MARKYSGFKVQIKTFNQSRYPRINRESLMPVARLVNIILVLVIELVMLVVVVMVMVALPMDQQGVSDARGKLNKNLNFVHPDKTFPFKKVTLYFAVCVQYMHSCKSFTGHARQRMTSTPGTLLATETSIRFSSNPFKFVQSSPYKCTPGICQQWSSHRVC